MIDFTNVSKSYPKALFKKSSVALHSISFFLPQGQTLGLIGANGAGKSTSIRLIMDFIRPTQGTIRIFDAFPNGRQLRQKIGYLPEIANFPANLTVLDVLFFTAKTCDISKDLLRQRSYNLLSLLDLWEVRRHPLRTYSKGMQQRANLAIALINDPELLILDEPMSGLDPIGRKKIIDIIIQLKNSGKTILFCSHILEDVDRLVDNILLLHKGRKLFFGTPGALATQEKKLSIAEAFVSLINKQMVMPNDSQ